MAQIEIAIEELSFNPFRKLDEQWMIVAAGNPSRYNGLTASWGGFGFVWGKNVATIYIRPQRYTKAFLDEQPLFSLSFFPDQYRDAVLACGRESGRDHANKLTDLGFDVAFIDDVPTFAQAGLTFVCRKLYVSPLSPDGFIDKAIPAEKYPDKDFSYLYIGEVTRVLRNEEVPDMAAIKKEEMNPASGAYSQAMA